MSIFSDYLRRVPDEERLLIEEIIDLVTTNASEATEGTSYGLPSFKYNSRPLLGFRYKDSLITLYPFDTNVITALRQELEGFEIGKGMVRFTHQNPLPSATILLMLEMRLEYLKSQD